MIQTIFTGLILGLSVGMVLGAAIAWKPRLFAPALLIVVGVASALLMSYPVSKSVASVNLAFHIPYLVGIFFGSSLGFRLPRFVKEVDSQARYHD